MNGGGPRFYLLVPGIGPPVGPHQRTALFRRHDLAEKIDIFQRLLATPGDPWAYQKEHIQTHGQP